MNTFGKAAAILVAMNSAFQVQASAAEQIEFRDWAYLCEAGGDCALSQTLIADDESWLGTLHLITVAGSGLALVARVPQGVHLPSGLFAQIPHAEVQRIEWRSCDEAGCLAVLGLDPGTLDAMRKGAEGQLVYRPFVDRPPLEVGFSLMGVSAGLDRLLQGEQR